MLEEKSLTFEDPQRNPKLQNSHEAVISTTFNVILNQTPKNYHEAINSPQSAQWTLAMIEELNSLRTTQTYQEYSLPAGRKAIRSMWTFKIKRGTKMETYSVTRLDW